MIKPSKACRKFSLRIFLNFRKTKLPCFNIMNVRIIFLIFNLIQINASQITDSEFNVSLSLIKHINAKNCIVISDSINLSLLSQIRFLTFSQNIYVTHKNSQELSKYITSEILHFGNKIAKFPDFPTHKIIILWKTNIDQINGVMSNVSIFVRI